MEIVIINWVIGGSAAILMVYAAYITLKATKRLAGELKTSILLIVTALISLLLMGLGTGVMAAKNVGYNEPIWLIIPSLALIGAILFVIGAKKLFEVLLGVSEKEVKG